MVHNKSPQPECEFSWRARHAELIVSLPCLEVSDWLLWAVGRWVVRDEIDIDHVIDPFSQI
jgi:hypothetical protein